MDLFRRLKTTKVLRWVGLSIFFVILTQIDLVKLYVVLKNINLIPIFAATLIFPVFILLKAIRWRLLLLSQNIKYSLWASYRAYLTGIFLGVITPGRIGEFVKAFSLKTDKGTSLITGMTSVLFDRLMDILILAVTAVLGLVFLSGLKQYFFLVILLISLFCLGSFILTNARFGRYLWTHILGFILPSSLFGQMNTHMNEFYAGMAKFRGKSLLAPLILSGMSIGILFCLCYLLAIGLNIPISFFYLASCVSISNIISLLPVSISGIGTRDVLLIALFSQVGLSAESAVSFSFMFLVFFSGMSALFGFIAWTLNPISFGSLNT